MQTVGNRAHVPQAAVQTLAVVEQFDVLEDVLPDFVHACVASTIDQLLLQAGEEALHRGVVIQAARRAHRRLYAKVIKHIAIPAAAVLRSAIRVENKVFVLAAVNHSQIDPAKVRTDIRDIAAPELVKPKWTFRPSGQF